MFNNKKKEKTKEEKSEKEEPDFDPISLVLPSEKPQIRTIGIIGEIDEEKAADTMLGLLMLTKECEEEKKPEPIEIYISTYGGNADDMFSIYDMMDLTKKSCEIHTYGLGKVMSAGVLLLSAGTKGKRKIGKNCRVMIHSCNAGSMGDIHNLQNEMEEIKHQQDNYINALVSESSLTKKQLTKLLDRKVNVYLTAQEAIEYGIADEMI